MNEYLLKILRQVGDFFSGLPTGKKISAFFITLVVVSGIIGSFIWASRSTFDQLFSGLSQEDLSNVVSHLQSKGIPYQLGTDGKSVAIPPEKVDIMRLEMASIGIAQRNIVGYEVFDSQPLGTTNFVQKINQKRAIEGELMRTIRAMKGVLQSRVHIAIPKDSPFLEDQKPVTASVVIEMEPGVVLDKKSVYGIGVLVSNAVEGLRIENVTIVDARGKVLSEERRDPSIAESATQADFKREQEFEFERKVKGVLEKIVGEGSVAVEVSVQMDFSKVNETRTLYDKENTAVGAVKSFQSSLDMTRPQAAGVAGAESNLPPGENVDRQVKNDERRSDTSTQYKVPTTVIQTSKSVGEIKNLMVSIVVDHKIIKEKGEDGQVIEKAQAWNDEELQNFSLIAAKAVGLDPKRGDSIEIKNIPFRREDFKEAQAVIEQREFREYVRRIIVYLVIGTIIAMFFIFVVRPFIKWATENTIDSVDTFLPQTIEELEKIQKNKVLPGLEDSIPVLPDKIDPDKVEGQMIKEKIMTLVDSHPHKAAMVLRDWIRGVKTSSDKAAGT